MRKTIRRQFGRPLLEKREKWRTPGFFGQRRKTNPRYTLPVKVAHPPPPVISVHLQRQTRVILSQLKWPTRLPHTATRELPKLRLDHLFRVGGSAPILESVSRQPFRNPGIPGYRIPDSDLDLPALAPHVISTNYGKRAFQQQ